MKNKYSIPERYKNHKVWSYSKLTSFEDCPYSFYLQRIKKVKSKDNIWSILGSISHEVIERLIKKEINRAQAKEMFLEKLNDCEITGINFPSKKIEDNYKKSILHYLSMFELPDVKDFHIERKEFLKLPNNNVLMGFIDFILLHNDDTVEIRDFKTSSKFSKDELAKKARQLIIYSEMIKQRYRKIKEIKVSYDMLKYAVVRYKDFKRTKTVERHKLVLLLRDKIEKDLLEVGYSEIEVDEIVIDAISKNKIPEKIKNNYTIEPYILYYSYGDTEINELYEWLEDIIQEIEESIEYPAKIEDDDSCEFWCKYLCGVSDECKFYKEFINKEYNEIAEDDDLF